MVWSLTARVCILGLALIGWAATQTPLASVCPLVKRE